MSAGEKPFLVKRGRFSWENTPIVARFYESPARRRTVMVGDSLRTIDAPRLVMVYVDRLGKLYVARVNPDVALDEFALARPLRADNAFDGAVCMGSVSPRLVATAPVHAFWSSRFGSIRGLRAGLTPLRGASPLYYQLSRKFHVAWSE